MCVMEVLIKASGVAHRIYDHWSDKFQPSHNQSLLPLLACPHRAIFISPSSSRYFHRLRVSLALRIPRYKDVSLAGAVP